jgi:hypothetical protein
MSNVVVQLDMARKFSEKTSERRLALVERPTTSMIESVVIVNLDTDFDDDGLETFKRYKPRSLDELASRTKFSKKEIQLIYQGFKQECPSGR